METKQKGGYLKGFEVMRTAGSLYPGAYERHEAHKSPMQQKYFWVFKKRGRRIVLKPPD